MIKFFSTGYLSRYLFIFIFGLILWIPSLLFPTYYNGISSFAFNQISLITTQNLFLQTIASFFFTLITAFLLNKCAIDNGLSGKMSTLIALVYLILTSSLAGDFHNNPVIWINFILVFVLNNLMRLPYVTNTIPVIFNASFLIGVASLFYSPLVFLVLLIWISVIVHRIVTWRNFVVSLVGVVLPYFLLLTLFFTIGDLPEESYTIFETLQINTDFLMITDPLEIAIAVILLLIIIISSIGIANHIREKNINLRRNLIITFFYIAFLLLILFVFTKSLVLSLLLCIPSAILMGHWLGNIKRTRYYDLAFYAVITIMVLNQYLYLILNL